MASLGERIRQARNARKLTQQQLGETLDVTRAAVAQWESNETDPIARLERIASALDVDYEWLRTGKGEIRLPAPRDAESAAHANVDLSRQLPVQGLADWPRDVPVLGIAVGGEEGYFEMNGQVIDYARRPPGIAGSPNVFAVYLDGESMAPWKERGDLVFVHRNRPVNIMDYVLVELNATTPGEAPKAMVKRLIKRTAEEYVLAQFRPEKEFRLARAKVRHVFKILGDRDLYGF